MPQKNPAPKAEPAGSEEREGTTDATPLLEEIRNMYADQAIALAAARATIRQQAAQIEGLQVALTERNG